MEPRGGSIFAKKTITYSGKDAACEASACSTTGAAEIPSFGTFGIRGQRMKWERISLRPHLSTALLLFEVERVQTGNQTSGSRKGISLSFAFKPGLVRVQSRGAVSVQDGRFSFGRLVGFESVI